MKEKSRAGSDKLTGFQVSVLISSAIVGASMISLPRFATEDAGTAGFLSILGGGGVAILATCVIANLSKRFPRQTFAEYSSQIVGRILGKGLGLIYAFYFALVASLANRFFADALKVVFLENTPVEIITISMFLVVIYLAQHGINPIARICEAFFPLVLIIFGLVMIVCLQRFQITRLLPAFQMGIMPILKPIPKTLFSYAGYEVILFIVPFMKAPGKVVKDGVKGLIFPILIYFSLVILTIGNLGIASVNYTVYPTLTLTKSVEFPGGFGERFDLFFFAFWILAAFSSIVIYYYLSALTLTRVINLRNYQPFIYFLLPFTYLLSISPQDLVEVEKWMGYSGYLGGVLVVIVPLTLLVIAFLRKKGEKSNA